MAAISSALDAAGLDRAALRPADLAPVDEFHIRGRAASLEIVEALGVTADSDVLDLGSGLGGPARTLAEVTGCTVTGVDLTSEFCEVATTLSEWTGLSGRTDRTPLEVLRQAERLVAHLTAPDLELPPDLHDGVQLTINNLREAESGVLRPQKGEKQIDISLAHCYSLEDVVRELIRLVAER